MITHVDVQPSRLLKKSTFDVVLLPRFVNCSIASTGFRSLNTFRSCEIRRRSSSLTSNSSLRVPERSMSIARLDGFPIAQHLPQLRNPTKILLTHQQFLSPCARTLDVG